MKLSLSDDNKATLEWWVKSRAVGVKQTLRAKIVLMTAEGRPTAALMDTLKVSNATLNLWRKRYLEHGLEGLKKGKSRPSRISPLSQDKVQEILTLTLTGKPATATHWSCRKMAEQVGVSRMTVSRVWRQHGSKPLSQ